MTAQLDQPSVPSIVLSVVDYDRLVQRNAAEVEKLFSASTTVGFFYLKLSNEQLNPDPMFTLAERVFALPKETKVDYAMDGEKGVYFGYKGIGSLYTDKKGTPDSIEFWNMSKDELLLRDSRNFPAVILDAESAVKDYIIKSHTIVLTILEILSAQLGLDPHTLPGLHRLMQPSGDQVRLTKSAMQPNPSDVALGAHTDFGSVTVLFNRLSGLQVLAENGDWLYVQPLPGHAIINLGDAMVKLTGGRLKSNIHRVVTTPGLREPTDRYSVVYFSRPENHVLMKSLIDDEPDDEDVLTAQQWVGRRVKNLQIGKYGDENTYELGRGTEDSHERVRKIE